jgi:hypothetical protein
MCGIVEFHAKQGYLFNKRQPPAHITCACLVSNRGQVDPTTLRIYIRPAAVILQGSDLPLRLQSCLNNLLFFGFPSWCCLVKERGDD